MLRLAAVMSCVALCWMLVTAGSFDHAPRDVARPAADAGPVMQIAQFNPCPNRRCR